MKSYWRNEIDSSRIQGLLLSENSLFLFLEYVCDFKKDGLLVLRKSDVTKSERTLTDEFQEKHLLESVGRLPVNVGEYVNAENWFSFFTTAHEAGDYVTIEEEGDGLLYMGQIVKVFNDRVVLKEFLGSGRWLDSDTEIYYDDITCSQIGNCYLKMYEKLLDNA